jgi:hypothetical protein
MGLLAQDYVKGLPRNELSDKVQSMMKKASLGLFLLLSLNAVSAEPKPKYGPEAAPLSQSHEYFLKHAAPDYWALSPFYIPQQDEKSCSLASVTMVINAARAGKKLTADDKLALQSDVLDKTKNEVWTQMLKGHGRTIVLDDLGPIVESALKAYGFRSAKAEIVHAEETSPGFAKKLHQDLVENEESANDFIIANFLQGTYTGDAFVGHIAPVGAYDASKQRVLILDPDREYYEPYWVSEAVFLKGMATKDSGSAKNRGYIYVQLNND